MDIQPDYLTVYYDRMEVLRFPNKIPKWLLIIIINIVAIFNNILLVCRRIMIDLCMWWWILQLEEDQVEIINQT